jgi:F0F1-type ATP synthase membrane subunit c/vacuolar-type H+-ATPase subunit K
MRRLLASISFALLAVWLLCGVAVPSTAQAQTIAAVSAVEVVQVSAPFTPTLKWQRCPVW